MPIDVPRGWGHPADSRTTMSPYPRSYGPWDDVVSVNDLRPGARTAKGATMKYGVRRPGPGETAAGGRALSVAWSTDLGLPGPGVPVLVVQANNAPPTALRGATPEAEAKLAEARGAVLNGERVDVIAVSTRPTLVAAPANRIAARVYDVLEVGIRIG